MKIETQTNMPLYPSCTVDIDFILYEKSSTKLSWY
jgi:hypothetical protein